jgi:hypothetical protein
MSNRASHRDSSQSKCFARTKPLRAEISKLYFKIYLQHLRVKKKIPSPFYQPLINGTNKHTYTMRLTFGDSEYYCGFRTIEYENIPWKVTH